MSYEQYSSYGYTGDVEAAKNRIPNNAYDSNLAEAVEFPNKYDLFVNKDNTTVGAFSVVESHTLDDLNGSTLYLDHRPDVDANGTPVTISSSDGTLDQSTLNLTTATIDFSTLPTATTFTVSYSARGDKVWDSHINALQNAVMRVQTTLGLRNAIEGVGTGLITLPLVTHMIVTGKL